ncbi:interleukin-6 receptor subunit beta-like [Anguilla rostrata]|uniref:interleukin-6 receptor subunit beta-like n=1 Tax=Anguilla rostrata TaxID=7938 RepID=UPI0030D18945
MDVSHIALLLLVLVCMVSHSALINFCCGKTYPESPVLELGQSFTATCVLSEDGMRETGATAKDIFWVFRNTRVPEELYTRINDSAVSVTVNVTRELENPLKCSVLARFPSHTREVRNVHGLFFAVGYPPEKPDNLSCVVLQSGKGLSPTMTCFWNPGERDPILNTTYTLLVETVNGKEYRAAARRDRGSVVFSVYPMFTVLNISVEVENALGKVRSDALILDSEYIVKTDPPKVKVVSEVGFPTSLIVRWEHPIDEVYITLKYNIRYCPAGAHMWSQVPPSDLVGGIKSFRLQYLEPYTDYVVQVRCMQEEGHGYWSEWSRNVSTRMPESEPSSPPDLWRIITWSEGSPERRVRLIWKRPVHSNGRILGYNLTIRTGNRSEQVALSSSAAEYVLEKVKHAILVELTAYNSNGSSPRAQLRVPRANQEPSSVKTVTRQPLDEGLWVGWEYAPPSPAEFVLDWVSVSNGTVDWKRVPGSSNYTVLTGALQPFERYNISVSPVWKGTPGRTVSTQAYLRQGRPSEGPSVKLKHSGKTEVQLVWEEPPLVSLNGFITNYTVFCRTEDVVKSVVLPPSIRSYTLKGLSGSTKYVVHVMVSTVAGSKSGLEFTFRTLKYASGEIELIVVLVCLGFLFFTVLTVLLGINKKEMIKKHIWPQVPDPSNSTIANWSPDYPSRPETPKEGSLTDVSVVEVDVFEKKSLGEEDKTSLPLKKDKYLSEEHSSGIGGSSCMSSPRQSVSDSDEGDSGQTTASTVQYSSVVASGYKGQTPGQPPPPVFARSESTQPLLGSEEHQDEPCQAHSYPRNPYFKRPRAADEGGTPPLNLRQIEIPEHGSGSLGFCSAEEGSQQTTPTAEAGHAEGPAGPAPSYMPQRTGYRPQRGGPQAVTAEQLSRDY